MQINQQVETYTDVATVLQQLARWMEERRKAGFASRDLRQAEESVIQAWMLIQEATR